MDLVLLALAAALPTCVALATELLFACGGKRSVFLRPGGLGLAVRRAHRVIDRRIPWLTGAGALASLALALSVGVMTRSGCLALGATLALGAHLKLYAQVSKKFFDDTRCLERLSASSADLAAAQTRWEVEMTTRASLHVAALVCIVASVLLA
jgi:hypothetical protein